MPRKPKIVKRKRHVISQVDLYPILRTLDNHSDRLKLASETDRELSLHLSTRFAKEILPSHVASIRKILDIDKKRSLEESLGEQIAHITVRLDRLETHLSLPPLP